MGTLLWLAEAGLPSPAGLGQPGWHHRAASSSPPPCQPDVGAQGRVHGGIAAHLSSRLPAGCNKLTDQALLYLRRISNVTLIDLRGCKQITRKACEHFISDLSINSLYCLSDEKLIQKIS